jgi:serine/threonine protein kinase
MITFSCNDCGMKFTVKGEFAGRSCRCPGCKRSLVVPGVIKATAPAGAIDGAASSIARAGLNVGVTLKPAAASGQKSVQEVLAGRNRTGERYHVEGEIARGGMGAVLRAVDSDIRREVAIKFMLDDRDPKKKLRFIEEAQITGQLEHPNIVPIHELGVDSQKRPFFSMKMVKGRSLAQVLEELRGGPPSSSLAKGGKRGVAEKEWSLGRLLNILTSVCNALAYAHSRGVVHRDLKPANIMIGDFGEVYVMDWGLAKVLRPNESRSEPSMATVVDRSFPEASIPVAAGSNVTTSRAGEADLTQEGAVLGTPAYMPPEQASGNVDAIDHRSDVYALGAILYEILTLQPPVDKEGGYLNILMRVMQGEILPPEQRAGSRKVPPELSAVAMKALAKDPRDRYPTIEALRRDIERFQEGRSVSAKEDTFREAMWKLVKRNRGVSVTAGLACIVLFGILVFSFRAVYSAYSTLQQEQTIRRQQGKDSARLFFQDAKSSASRKEIDYALAQVNVALDYDPDIAEARLLKAQLLIVQKKFPAARQELEQYLRHRPDDADAVQMLDLCQKARPDDATSSAPFAAIFERQKSFSLAEQMVQDRDRLLLLYRKRVDAVWFPFGRQLTMNKDGSCALDLSEAGNAVSDLTPLQGLPLSRLNLSSCGLVRDLTPLKGMPLTRLDLSRCSLVRDVTPLQDMKLIALNLTGTQVADLTPLKGMPLATLHLHGCRQVADLTPLQSFPIKSLDIGFCPQFKDLSALRGLRLTFLSLYGCDQIRDLGPLKGMPLAGLNLQNCGQIQDLTPLKGMPLTSLNLQSCGQIQDLTPLKGMPLTSLNLCRCTQVRDLTPLQGMSLTEITLTPSSINRGMDVLRNMRSLKTIAVGTGMKEQFKTEDFWQRYNAGEFK